MQTVKDIAKRIIPRSDRSALLQGSIDNGMQTDIDRAIAFEADIFGLCFATEDQKKA